MSSAELTAPSAGARAACTATAGRSCGSTAPRCGCCSRGAATWCCYAVLAILPIFIGVAVKVSAPRGGDGPEFLSRITGNGLFLIFTALTVSIPFFLPLVVGVAGR